MIVVRFFKQILFLYFKAYKNTFNTKGRSSRSECWILALLNSVLLYIFTGSALFYWGNLNIGWLMFFAAGSMSIRRMHDIGRSCTLLMTFSLTLWTLLGFATAVYIIKDELPGTCIECVRSLYHVSVIALKSIVYYLLFFVKGDTSVNKYGLESTNWKML